MKKRVRTKKPSIRDEIAALREEVRQLAETVRTMPRVTYVFQPPVYAPPVMMPSPWWIEQPWCGDRGDFTITWSTADGVLGMTATNAGES